MREAPHRLDMHPGVQSFRFKPPILCERDVERGWHRAVLTTEDIRGRHIVKGFDDQYAPAQVRIALLLVALDETPVRAWIGPGFARFLWPAVGESKAVLANFKPTRFEGKAASELKELRLDHGLTF